MKGLFMETNSPANSNGKTVDGQTNLDGSNNAVAITAKKAAGAISRRTFVTGVGGTVLLFALGGVRFAGATPLVRPPGGQDYDRLIAGCIRCEKCIEVCPHHVIKLANIEDGIIGMRTPILTFRDDCCNWCAQENNGVPLCAEVCPTEALVLPPDATAENTLLGLAELNTSTCLAYRDTGCRFCYDACPYQAMELNEHKRPLVINNKCNGCGACEAVCVSLENGSIVGGINERAIVVRALDVNGRIVNGLSEGGASS
jgi:ferredoxin-type protein NapG